MKRVIPVLAVVLVCVGCGRFLSAIPRYTEIERPVTEQEAVGHWVLSTNSLSSVAVDGFRPMQSEEVAITIRSNGSYSAHRLALRWGETRQVDRWDESGKWSLDYESKRNFKNQILLRSTRDAGSFLWIAFHSERMVLWESWGDPDDGVDLVYEKAQKQ